MSDLGLQANWRKNRRRNAGGSYGVDLNRNYPFGWSFTCGGSTTETSSNYRGTQAASEPEVRTMIAFQVCVACTPPRSVPPSYHPRTILVPSASRSPYNRPAGSQAVSSLPPVSVPSPVRGHSFPR